MKDIKVCWNDIYFQGGVDWEKWGSGVSPKEGIFFETEK